MSKRVIALVVFVLVCPIVRGADTNILSSASPNLKKFLSGYPTAMTAFTNAMLGTFSNRTVKIFYYYSHDPDDRRPSHFYPHAAGMPDVIICVAQDSRPVDEFIGILYEMLNSKGEKRFGDLCEKAKAGTISRDDFARDVLRVEFDAVIRTRKVLLHLGLTKKEMKQSHHYHYFFDTPTDFEGFLSYQRSLFPPNHGPMEEYESKYDWLRESHE